MARTRLRSELTMALALKLAALIALYVLFFSPSHRVHVTPMDMATALAKAPHQPAR